MDSGLIRARAPLPKPLLLKDYLLDDMSSCSSNGFQSFPRTQCCTAVRFIHEFDRKTTQQQQKKKTKQLNKTPSTKSAIAAFQSVIIAVKRLPFPAAKSPEKSRSGTNSFLPRSFSKKIFKKSSFWKKKVTTTTTVTRAEEREIRRWKSFDELLKEDPSSLDMAYASITTSENQRDSCNGIDFTVPTDDCLSGNSTTERKSNLHDSRNDAVEKENKADTGNMAGATNDDVSVDSTTSSNGSAATKSSTTKGEQKRWASEEKEQFSPVSVLDCPFDDEDEVSSPFEHGLPRMEGTKRKLVKKIQMLECLAKFEPVNLSSRFAPHPSSSTDAKSISDTEESEEGNEAEQKALELFHRTKANSPSCNLKLKSDNLLLDFFRENITNHEREITREKRSSELLEAERDWIDGVEPRGNVVEWGAKKNREGYVKDMEKGGMWKTLDLENNEVALELEYEVYSTLLHELVLDMASAN